MKEKKAFVKSLKGIIHFFSYHKIPAIIVIIAISFGITATVLMLPRKEKLTLTNKETTSVNSTIISTISRENSSTDNVSENFSSAIITDSSSKIIQKPESSKPSVTQKPIVNGDYHYNTNLNIEDNVFLDSLIYTGYNINKHRSDGKLWKYILAPHKRGLGYLSNITYGAGSSGYETNTAGRPDIKAFERGGLVCASYVTYVYFNYLPNVAGIDTDILPRPDQPTLANSWYRTVKQWVDRGYSKKISFTASKTSAGFINFKPQEEIPIGSIIVFCDAKKKDDVGSHVVIYAGYKNNYHWVFHVGNQNGPEFCAVERMHFGPDPQWPLAVVTTPSNIRMSAAIDLKLTNDAGNPIPGTACYLKNQKTGSSINLGKTNNKGLLSKEGLAYGDYVLSYTVPEGYTCAAANQKIQLITANNSKNVFEIKFTKKQPISVSSESISNQPNIDNSNKNANESKNSFAPKA